MSPSSAAASRSPPRAARRKPAFAVQRVGQSAAAFEQQQAEPHLRAAEPSLGRNLIVLSRLCLVQRRADRVLGTHAEQVMRSGQSSFRRADQFVTRSKRLLRGIGPQHQGNGVAEPSLRAILFGGFAVPLQGSIGIAQFFRSGGEDKASTACASGAPASAAGRAQSIAPS